MLNNKTRLTVRSDGLYLLGAEVEFASLTGGVRYVDLLVNSTDAIDRHSVPVSNSNAARLSSGTIWYFEEGDYIEVRAFANVANCTAKLESFWIVAITPEGII